jgi:transcription-repair coupling factor (superfamily II helicase)
LQFLAEILNRLPEYRSLSGMVSLSRPIAVTGLSEVHKAHIAYALALQKNKKIVIIAPDEQEATKFVADLNTFFGGGVYFYPSRDFTLRQVEGVSHEFEHERLRILGRMEQGDFNAVVCCADAAMQLTLPPQEYRRRATEIKKSRELPPKQAVKALLMAGYARAEQVEGMGQFAVRGGILDFFPPHTESPIRVEFWGDEPDTISTFDIATQRRLDEIDSVLITPAVEVLFDSSEGLAAEIEKVKSNLKTKSAAKAVASLGLDIDRLTGGASLPSNDRYLPISYGGKPGRLLDFAPDALVFVSEPARVKEREKNTLWQHGEDLKVLLEDGVLCKGLDRFYLDIDDLEVEFEKRGAIFLDTFVRTSYETQVCDIVHFTTKQLSVWGGGLGLITEDLKAGLEKGGSAVVLAGTPRACEALVHDLNGENINAYTVSDPEKYNQAPPARTVLVLPSTLSAGMEYPSINFTVITHGHVNGEKRSGHRYKKGEHIRSLSELTPGDFVVHSAHGIGVYAGIHKLDVQGVVKDYIKIRYAGTDTLYVPVTQLDLVSKYIGAHDDGGVRLSKMGGAEWQKAKSRTRAAVKDMAKELIALYAERQKVKGIAFSEDNDWQRQFEERFEYDETGDQLRCVVEIKADMEKQFPMERLLCGDVGFGKTEVALRAAFKCVMGGKQCAMLVPTTILAWQHFQTITRRVEGFPVNVELLSRFRTAKQQKEILKKLARGDIDIIIGTHRLVQKDVKFRDLGLLIIDEEQRFGVAHKEKLKERFKDVDVLTLSATPIPRTLNMALSGIRDMSAIEEAPQDRHPVQTYVLEHDWGVIADAIRKEMRRGGQVYYLHNRVETIESTAAKIASLIPDVKIGIGHGKMDEDELSQVWERLLNHDIDVLVCTTIIETGVDVPNCNTLIIEDADRMGLSQLHQIRGRVGRSARRAFAYFTFKTGKVLTDVATKRLSAIREFTEFGSGFQIALRDLEIRGAGNILGSQQHGHMEAVGYDMYLKLLNEAVLEEKGEAAPVDYECMVDIQVSAHIPEDYIESSNQRLEIYRRIADIRGDDDVSDVLDELIDRFGEPPQAVKSLVDVALVRNMAAQLGIKEISQRSNVVMLFADNIDFKAVSGLVAKLRGRVMVSMGQKPYVSVKLAPNQSPVDAIREALNILTGEKISK